MTLLQYSNIIQCQAETVMSKWTVQDRYGNAIYCTEERWQHILTSRPELEPFFLTDSLKQYALDDVNRTHLLPTNIVISNTSMSYFQRTVTWWSS